MSPRPLAILAATFALSVAGCERSQPARSPVERDALFIRTNSGIAVVSAVTGDSAVRLSDAVPSTDWSAVVQATRHEQGTAVRAFDSSSGVQLWSRDVPGALEVKVASKDGRIVALGTPTGRAGGYPEGRSRTPLVVIDQEHAGARTLQLRGNYEPEAFSIDGRSLFVIEYRPATRPTSYRVRRLDLNSERVVGVYTVDAELQQSMQGTARVQAASPDGRRLYTLYTTGEGKSRTAFVHVLSLDELWAHCVDLPSGFGTSRERDMALAVSPSGTRLQVVDGSTGAVAEIDTEALAVSRTGQAPLPARKDYVHAAIGGGGTLYVGRGARVWALDPVTLTPARSWDLRRSTVTGLQAGSDGSRLYVGLQDEILIVDTTTGARLGVLAPENVEDIAQLGRASRPVAEERTDVVCAC